MEAPSRRMRLTVVVEALAEENAHGEYRDMALAAFKERKFAMPVQLENTFETVWNDIEQRYKTNYLNPQQAATFSIKKLQDAYDCDLDMTDTVASIFEGETDRKMHMIRVIPHFIYRETSVVPGSMLRPTGAQKRVGDDLDDGANKRQRVASQQRQSTYEAPDPSSNQPIPSTEQQQAAAEGAEHIEAVRRMTRSKSGMSLVEISRTETGQASFSATAVKQEPSEALELEQPPALHDLDVASPHGPAQTSPQQPQQPLLQPADNEVSEPAAETRQEERPAVQEQTEQSQIDPQEASIQHSPISSVEPDPAPAPAANHRKDIYQVPSSPEFMQPKVTPAKSAKTYGRSPKSGADLLNMARRIGRPAEENITEQNGTPASMIKQARVFQRPQADEIESTPQEAERTARSKSHATSAYEDDSDADLTASFLDEAAAATPKIAQTPARKAAAKAKPGSLKTPSRASLVSTPASTKLGTRTKATATPASTASASQSKARKKPATSSNLSSSKGERMRVSLGSIEDLLSASQMPNKRQGSAASPAQSGSLRSRQSSRSSPEVRIPAKENVPTPESGEATNARLAAVPRTVQRTPLKSPVPLPPSTRNSASVSSATPNGAVEISQAKKSEVFKKPAAKVREAPVPKPTVEKVAMPTAKEAPASKAKETPTPAAKNASKTIGTPRRSQVPLPLNVRHLQRSSSSQSSPRASGEPETSKSSPAATVKTPANAQFTKPSPATMSNKNATKMQAAPKNAAKPPNGVIEISSAESSSSDSPSLDVENQTEDAEQVKPGMDGTMEDQGTTAEKPTQQHTVDSNEKVGEKTEQPKTLPEHEDLATHIAEPQTRGEPPSGQETKEAAPWGTQSWSFGGLAPVENADAQSKQNDEPEHEAVTAAAVASEDQGFAEQEIYSTAIEDNASGSRSDSAGESTRSSPAVSRRPARFLSHSPTPDASESEDDADEATAVRAASPQVNDNEESDSDSDSSSDSSDDEDVELADLPAGTISNANTKEVPPSSPPVDTTTKSTPIVPETSQPTPSQNRLPIQRTPFPPPTQQSSQAPRSSQSVSVQAADRRRYTGFRSLREQLADTRAAQATTQKKVFDPRTMNLGKLVKGKPPTGLGGGDDSSDDESSSSDSGSD